MAKDRKIDLVILGLLVHDDLTGYDIIGRVIGSDTCPDSHYGGTGEDCRIIYRRFLIGVIIT